MLGHVSFGVAELGRSQAFWDGIMAPLGWVRLWTHPKGLGYGPPGGGERVNLFLWDEPGVRLAAGPRFHLAFDAPDPAAVDAFHAAAVAAGGVCEGPPGLREHYSPTYYAAFVRDPDGHKLECVHQSAGD